MERTTMQNLPDLLYNLQFGTLFVVIVPQKGYIYFR